MFRLCCWFDQKTGIVFYIFIKDSIWARPNWCAQNRYTDVENSLYQRLRKELFAVIGQLCLSVCNVSGSGREELKK